MKPKKNIRKNAPKGLMGNRIAKNAPHFHHDPKLEEQSLPKDSQKLPKELREAGQITNRDKRVTNSDNT